MFQGMIRAAPASALALALSACATSPEGPVGFVEASYDAELNGAAVVGAGDPDGSAVAQITVTRNADAVCYNIRSVRGIGEATGARIHRGYEGQEGPVVAQLPRGGESGWNGCINSTELAKDLLRPDPPGFYIQIQTVEYPGGALRGQLRYD